MRPRPARGGGRASAPTPERGHRGGGADGCGGDFSIQLFVAPVVGLADNRDYERVIGYAGFQHTTDVSAERYFSFLRTQYAVVAPGWFRGGYHSSETLLAFVARFAHAAVSREPLFDIRLLGAIHVTLLLLVAPPESSGRAGS